jgi:hypothetical protein
MEKIAVEIANSLIALKDNPLALVCIVALSSLAVTAYAIRAIIVAVINRGEKS